MIPFSSPSHAVLTLRGQDEDMTTLMSALKLAALLSMTGEPDGLPRSLADDYPMEVVEQQDDPPQDPLRPPTPPKKEDFAPRQPEGPILEHPHDSIGGFFRTHFSEQGWDTVWENYLTEPPVLVPLGFAVGAGAVSHWDKPLASHIQGTLGHHRKIGDWTMYALVGGSVVLNSLLPGEGRNGWDNFWEAAEVHGVTALLTCSLKIAVGRIRPSGGNHSFPSGHTSASFAAASLLDDNFGAAVGIPAYGAAGLVGYSRIESGAHYPSDVLAGAAIGILSAGVLDVLHWGRGPESHGIAGGLKFELEPLGDRGAMAGFSLQY